MSTAWIAGGSGLVGGCLLRELLAATEYDRVVAVSRRPLGLDLPARASELVADFSALSSLPVSGPADDAYCCLGTTIRRAGSREAFRDVDHRAVLAFAWAARRAGAKRFFLVSSLGADAASRTFYLRVKGETEEALDVLGFGTLAVFRPSLLRGPRRESRPGERLSSVVLAVAEPLLLGRWRKYRAIEAVVVARAMLRCSFGRGDRGRLTYESDEIQDLGR